jgi:hypothetical protein
MAASSSNIDHNQLSSSTSSFPTIELERAHKKIKYYIRVLYRHNIHLEPEVFSTLFESGVMGDMIKVIKNKERKKNRTVDDIQPRKRFRGADMKPEKHGTIEGQLEDSSSALSSDDENDDDYYYDPYLNYVDSDEEPNTADNNNNENHTYSNNPMSFTHTSTQTDDQSI